MTYYIHPIWFYLSDVCSGLKWTFGLFAGGLILLALIGFLIISGIATEMEFNLDEEEEKEQTKYYKKFKLALIIGIIFCCLFCITPTKEGVTKMMIASVVTYENVDTVKGDVKEIVDYITEKAIEIKSDKTEE